MHKFLTFGRGKRVKLGQGRKACAKEMIFPAVLGVHSGGIAKL